MGDSVAQGKTLYCSLLKHVTIQVFWCLNPICHRDLVLKIIFLNQATADFLIAQNMSP